MSGRLRPRQVVGFILLGFMVVIAVEIAVAVLVAQLIGPWLTMFLILAFSFAGLFVVRKAGARSVGALRQAAAERRLPGGELADHALLLVGGILMIPPGFLLDLLGLVFVLPVTRPVARRLSALVLRGTLFTRMTGAWPRPTHPVVQGEVLPDPHDPWNPRNPDNPDNPNELGPGRS
jgi:UPF0716 protein FxsA